MQIAARWTCAMAVVAALGVASQANAQAFSEVKKALVDYSKADFTPRKTCDAVAARKWKEVVAIKATVVEAAGDVPSFCRIAGTIAPEVAFEVTMPAHWNGRFYMIGNGGHAGQAIDDPARITERNGALKLGFAFAQTNTGHDSTKEPGGTFVLSNPAKAIDYAYRAVHVTAATAKDMIAAYYPKPAKHSYWNSCSNGGRQGLMEAQRFPKDFDGVIANAPWSDQTGFTIGGIWNQLAIDNVGLTPAKLSMVSEKVMARCDAIDGLQDGLIDDPRKCDFNPRRDVPSCAAGVDNAACLTTAQADAIAKVYSGPVVNGKQLFPGFMPGSEAAWSGMIVPAQPGAKPAVFNLAEGTIRYLAHTPPNPDYDYRNFDFARDTKLLDGWSVTANATDPDLKKFQASGGKLLMTYGWADQILQPLMGVNYYEAVLQKSGKQTMDFARLFMVPGMSHCSGGIGTDQFDSMTALINWVEKGKAPDSMVASRVFEGRVARSRPLCPYPQVARYSGKGSVDDAANFSCAAP
jgi:Tannase and feruloyl esterase